MNKLFVVVIFICVNLTFFAQEKWDVNKHKANSKEVEFTVKEGTWMNLDVSPDGKTIVFDLLGDIYSLDIKGGEATLLRGGLAFEVQPRFSPDGKKISFTSDAGGGDNIWIMNTDGENAHQVTKENFRLLNNAVWTPDGNYIITRKHFTSTRSLGAGEMWLYHTSGGTGFQLTKRKNDQQDVGEPSISPDGRYVYYSEDVYPGGYFQYNKDPNNQIYVIKRYDREKGETENVVTGAGGAFRPQISKDGKLLAFVRRVQEKTVLFLQDLHTGEEWPIYDDLTKDQQEAWAIFGVYPNFNWMPDNQNIIIYSKGKIKKINVQNYSVSEIPFTVNSKHQIAETVKFKNNVFTDKIKVKVIRHAVTSPDEKFLLFSAVGYLWKKDLPNGTPKRLTEGTDFEFEPSFSPDGKEIVYVTWSDKNKGSIYKRNLKTGKSTKINSEKAIYRTPSFSPDGKQIVYWKESGNSHNGFTFTKKAGIYTMSASGGEPKFIIDEESKPTFNKNGDRIFYLSGEMKSGKWWKKYESVDLNGNNKFTHFSSEYGTDFVPSNDNNWIAFAENYKVYIAPFPTTGKTISLTHNSKAIEIANVARDEGINLHWSENDKKLFWTLGDEYYSNELKNRFKFLEGAPDSIPSVDTSGLKINLVINSDKPKGKIAFTNAKIITMNGSEIIENGTIIVEENKILEVGKSSDVNIPSGTKVYDVKGKVIMPGIVDVHAHMHTWNVGITPQQEWSYYANLAYGITTTHDPSSSSETVFSQSEMVKLGTLVGPRIFSTGTILYGADGDIKTIVDNIDDARSAIRRMKAYGAFSVKSYNQPRREQRQQILQAARENNIMVYPEGGSTFFTNLSEILDGHTGIEHNLPIAPLYDDVINLWKNSETGYTPTLVVCYGGMSGEMYWYQHTNVWEKTRLMKYIPRNIIETKARHRIKIPEKEYENGHILVSKSCKKLTDAGVKVNVGGHGQLQGLGIHWEMWMLSQGGMTNMEVLRSGTMNGAEYLGMEKEIGSLEKGKLADLIVLNKDPLENIRNTEFVKYTMINGRLYDSEEMSEIGNYNNSRSKFFFENEKYNSSFNWHEETNGITIPHCSCGK